MNKRPTNFKAARAASGKTQEQVAEATGVTPSAVSQWETGLTSPLGASRILLANLFNVDVDTVDSWFAKDEAIA